MLAPVSIRMENPSTRRRRRIAIAVISAIIALVVVLFTATPWPSALLIRASFERGATKLSTEMSTHVPDVMLDEQRDISYDSSSSDARLDVYRPASAEEPLPVIVWVHGGAWISGSKDDVAPYLKKLAAEGYATVGVDYSLGPEANFPTAAAQVNEALGYISEHADELGVDAGRIILAGDSAGAQLASQAASLVTSPRYARTMGIQPTIKADQLDGIILHCGVYDLEAMANLTGVSAWSLKSALWAYTGMRSWSQFAPGALMSIENWVTEDFPPTFISGGNGDALTWSQSIPMAEAIAQQGVDVTEVFFSADHEPELPHEYQFHLDLDDAQRTYDKTVDYLTRVTEAAS